MKGESAGVSLENKSAGRASFREPISDAERELLERLIARSGVINRLIMRLYLDIDILGLDRWFAYIHRIKGKKRLANLFSYWPIRIIERVSAIYVGGSLTAEEQKTFSRICRVQDYKLSRYNALIFGSATGILFFSSGKFTSWLGSLGTIFDKPLGLTSFILYSIATISVGVDIFRFIDSYLRKKAHMPFGIFPFVINSTTFLKRLSERLRR